MTTAQVYQAITAVINQMGQDGISKSRKNLQQGYNFRGIDDVFNALSPMLSAHKLCILPYVLERQCDERLSAKGGALFYVTVKVRFDFISAEDGSKHEVVTYGEAMDSGDKATNKAMSAAYKYAAMQAFCIPTEGDNDADSTTHDVTTRPKIAPEAMLSTEELFEIKKLAHEINVSLDDICKAGKVKDIADIPASKFINLCAWIKKQGEK